MKKIMIAGLGLSLLSGTAVFAQNSSAGSGGQMGNGTTTTKKHKKHKKSKKSDQMGTDSSAAPKA
jgi:hypothetical protein